jgi:hypothetical protein
MSSIKVPQDKKRVSLQKDHRTFPLEGNRSFRSAWRIKKKQAIKSERRTADRELAHASDMDREDLSAMGGRRGKRKLVKFGVMQLCEAIAVKNAGPRLRWSAGVRAKRSRVARILRQDIDGHP